MFKKILSWIEDYVHGAYLYSKSFWYRKPPEEYLGHVVNKKVPIILIPGVNTKWPFLKMIADEVSAAGHPVYTVKDLGYNRKEIRPSAVLVRNLIDSQQLKDVIILAHSKGGLIGKELLMYCNSDVRIQKVIAIASPFAGSGISKIVPDKVAKELGPESVVILEQNLNTEVNKDIISVYGTYDNHVWPTESCRLDGAENIQVAVDGHHKILSYPEARKTVVERINTITTALEREDGS